MRAIKKSNSLIVASNTKIKGDNNVIKGDNNVKVVGDYSKVKGKSNKVREFKRHKVELGEDSVVSNGNLIVYAGSGDTVAGKGVRVNRKPGPHNFGCVDISGTTRFSQRNGKIVTKGYGTLDGIEIGPGTYWKTNGQVYRTLEGSQTVEMYDAVTKVWQKVE